MPVVSASSVQISYRLGPTKVPDAASISVCGLASRLAWDRTESDAGYQGFFQPDSASIR